MTPRPLGVLIVDDSLTVRMDLEEAFRPAGFETVLCSTASEAREALRERPFAVAVLDVLLPDGDGLALLKEIKSAPGTRDLPVLLLSSEAEVADRIRGLKTGADDYVGKPYQKAYVLARAKELLRSRSAGSAREPGMHILVIDDSETYRFHLRDALEARGYVVATATTGEEGLQMAADVRPRAVIVDGVLPGIDGATVVRRLRQDAALRTVPCLLLTASLDRGGELRAFEAGADSYARKEEDLDAILARLSAMLRASGGPPPPDAVPSLLGPKKILAVDDSPTYLEMLSSQLRGEGYEPILARSGQEALELLTVQRVDCILLDLVMPGLTGDGVCRRIKATPGWRDIPLVILTAKEDREAMIEGINAGADDFISKSGDFDVLKARLRAQLRRKQFEDENRRIRQELVHKEIEAAEARAARELAETRAGLLAELEQKNKELEAFSYSVSHDLRAPLRAIDGFARILEEDGGPRLNEEDRRHLAVVRASAARMGRLIDDLLAFSRLGRQAMTKVSTDLAELAREVVEELRRAQPDRAIETTIGPLPSVPADRALMRHVLTNLVSNAFKYTGRKPRAVVEIGGRVEGERAVYFVKDNGAGFDMRYRDKLFGVFQRLHRQDEFDGTGVGLAIVARIVARHGGAVWAEGAPDEGATFWFWLPATSTAPGAPAPGPPPA
jgi:DNA-binding response OmpR family regulator/two-component sensor histidine kinase